MAFLHCTFYVRAATSLSRFARKVADIEIEACFQYQSFKI